MADPAIAAPLVGLRYQGWQRHAKRGLDLLLILVSAPITLVLMVGLAAVVRITSPGPALFRQERVGQGGQMFTILKFRTMYVDSVDRLHADEELYRQYVAHDFKLPAERDPRLVPFGRFLRRTSLDELPQLLNVLAGSMSLVGPRPIVADELECYGPWARAYLVLKPGITGRWQSNGRNAVRYPERAMGDAEYLENWSLATDIWIILKTIPAVIRRHGAH